MIILLDRIKKFIANKIGILFPYFAALEFNKIVSKKIDNLNEGIPISNPYIMDDYQALTIEQLMGFLTSILEKKKSLEEKAKVNVVGVTIAVTLIFSLYNFIGVLNSYETIPLLLKIIVCALSFYVIVEMILGGVAALTVLGDVIEQNEMFPKDLQKEESERKNVIARYTELNANRNYIRNNLLWASYSSIKYSLIGLCFLFLILLPVTLTYTQRDKESLAKIHQTLDQIQLEQSSLEGKLEKLTDKSSLTSGDSIENLQKQIKELSQKVNMLSGSD